MRTINRTFTGHSKPVRDLAFSPDGRCLASVSNDHSLRLWDVSTGEHVALSDHSDIVTSVAFSASGDVLVSGSADKTARLRDPVTGAAFAVLRCSDEAAFIGDIRGGLTDLALCRDASLLATITSRSDVYVWDLARRSERSLDGLKKPWCESVAVSPDGQWVSAATLEKTGRLWNTATRRCRLLKGHGQKITCVAFSFDGRFLATAGSYDAATFVWDPVSLAGAALISSRPAAVSARGAAFAISPDSSRLARVNHDNSVEAWDVSPASLAGAAGPLAGTSFTPHSGPVRALCFSPDSRRLATAGASGEVVVSDLASGDAAARASLGGLPGMGVYSPDGRRLAFSVDSAVVLVELDV